MLLLLLLVAAAAAAAQEVQSGGTAIGASSMWASQGVLTAMNYYSASAHMLSPPLSLLPCSMSQPNLQLAGNSGHGSQPFGFMQRAGGGAGGPSG